MADDDKTDQELFDITGVSWDILPSKRRDQVTLVLKCHEGTMSVLKTYLALKMIAEKIELELNIMDEADGQEH